MTLAGTLLTIDPNDARSRILLALVLTMAPFAVVGPLIGPALDRMRGARRATIAFSLLLRAALMVLLIRNLDTNWFFPIAFAWLVLGKTYSVAKAATVPTTVHDQDELVDKNSRLAILSAVAGVAGVVPAAGLYRLFGATPTLWWAAIVYLVGVLFSMRMPRVIVDDPATTDDDVEIRSAGVKVASYVMAVLRGVVGFVFFLLLFEFVRSELPDLSGVGTAAGAAVKSALGFELLDDPGLPWYQTAIPFGLWGLGGFAGNVIAPWFRKRFSEERMLIGAVGAIALAAIAATWAGGLAGAALVALIVGGAASGAKLAFDSLVQRDAPGANHGAAFGRFETQFQIAWVIGSLLAVVVSFPLRAGFLAVAIATVGIGLFVLRRGGKGDWSFGPSFLTRDAEGGGTRRRRRPRQSDPTGPEAPPAPPAPLPDMAPTTQIQAVDVTAVSGHDVSGHAAPAHAASGHRAPADGQSVPAGSGRDPYAEAFAETAIEPPDWAASVFDDNADEPVDLFSTPDWLNEPTPHQDPRPTPPMGTKPVD